MDNGCAFTTRKIASFLGSDFALHLVLDLHTEKHMRIGHVDRSLSTGVEVLVHHPSRFPLMSSGSIPLSPGLHHYLSVEMTHVERLSEPYSEKPCITDADYKFNECLFKCQLDLQYAECSCYIHDVNHPNACTLYSLMYCYDSDINAYYTEGCSCKPPCSSYKYSMKQTAIGLPSEDENMQHLVSLTGINRTTWNDIQKNIVYLQIYFETMEYHVVKEKPSYVLHDLMANIGGLLGLFLGASAITLIELLEQTVLCGYKAVSKRSNRVNTVKTFLNINEKHQNSKAT